MLNGIDLNATVALGKLQKPEQMQPPVVTAAPLQPFDMAQQCQYDRGHGVFRRRSAFGRTHALPTFGTPPQFWNPRLAPETDTPTQLDYRFGVESANEGETTANKENEEK